MLRKVLKYDLKSVWRYWWIASVIFTAVTLVAAIYIRFFIEFMQYTDQAPELLSGAAGELVKMLIIVTFLAVVVAFILSLACFTMTSPLLMCIKYYSNFFSDRGYLTFTLPVSRRIHLLSKTLSSIIWELITMVQLFLMIGVMLLIVPPTYDGTAINPEVFRGFEKLIDVLVNDVGAWVLLYGVLLAIMIPVMSFYGTAILQLCITFGSTVARKHKVVASIGAYLGFTVIMSVGSQLISFCVTFMLMGLESVLLYATVNETMLVGALFLALSTVATAAVGLAAYCTNLNILERKLNLA